MYLTHNYSSYILTSCISKAIQFPQARAKGEFGESLQVKKYPNDLGLFGFDLHHTSHENVSLYLSQNHKYSAIYLAFF